MLVSVYTPTHTLAYLEQAWASLKRQTHRDFEWILIPNGPLTNLPADIVDDPRVMVYPAPDLTGNVGALKRFACQHARGDLLVEFDHDDLLATQALNRLVSKADVTKPQFLYSDFASMTADMQPVVYSPIWGWDSYNCLHDGRLLKASRAFECCPSALLCLQYSPNHIRAWTRPAYLKAGGYSDKYSLADDYDLLIRTFLSGAEFIRIPECLYMYRTYPDATSRKQNLKIQQLQQQLANQHADAILAEWCRRHNHNSFEMAISTGQQSTMRLIYPLANLRQDEHGAYEFPGLSDLPESSVGQLACYNVLPYLDRRLIMPFMEACYRALVPGGWLRCRVPSANSAAGFANPLYRSYWNLATFRTFTNRQQADLAGGHKARFQYLRAWDTWFTDEDQRTNMITSCVDLVALKGQKQPGLLEI